MSIKLNNDNDFIEVYFDHVYPSEVSKMLRKMYSENPSNEFAKSLINCSAKINTNKYSRCTLATIKINKRPICTGISYCSSQDNFCKAIGRKIALKRAVSASKQINNLNFVSNEKLWKEYLLKCKV